MPNSRPTSPLRGGGRGENAWGPDLGAHRVTRPGLSAVESSGKGAYQLQESIEKCIRHPTMPAMIEQVHHVFPRTWLGKYYKGMRVLKMRLGTLQFDHLHHVSNEIKERNESQADRVSERRHTEIEEIEAGLPKIF